MLPVTSQIPGVRSLLFDLDGTLFDRDSSLRPLLEEQYALFAPQLGDVPRELFIERVTVLDDHGYGDKPSVYAQIAQEFRLREGLAAELLEHFWSRYTAFCFLFEGVVHTLEELRRFDIRLGIITNGKERIQQAKVDALGISKFMSVILISEREGIRKPDLRIFHRAAEVIGLDCSACCYVGDHPDVAVAGALSAGMNSIWKRTAYWTAPIHSVPIIDSIPEILMHIRL